MRTKDGMRPARPGEVLCDEFEGLGLSVNALSKALGVPVNRVRTILNSHWAVSADPALRLERHFGTTPQSWLNLQETWELRQGEIEAGHEIARFVMPRQLAARGAVAHGPA